MTTSSERKRQLLLEAHRNGLEALRTSVEFHTRHPEGSSADTGIFDCFVGNTLTAYVLAKDADMPQEVRDWIQNTHKPNENWHCQYAIAHDCPRAPEQMAKMVQDFHKSVVDDLGWVGYFVCMPLTGERMAMGTAFALKPPTSAHATPQGFTEEFNHASYPLLLLERYADELILAEAVARQRQFVDTVRKGWENFERAASSATASETQL